MSPDESFNALFTHHKASVNDVDLHYVMGGRGDPIVLLHGLFETWYEWHRIMPDLAENYTVIVPDLRGLGDSSKPVGGYDKRTVAEDVFELVRNRLGFERVFLVGHDWGGAVAYAYTAAHREHVRRLAFVEMVLPGFGYEAAMQPVPGGGHWYNAFFTVPDWPEFFMAGKERAFMSWIYRRNAYNTAAFTETDIDEYVRCYSAPGALRCAFDYYRALWEDAEHNQESAKTPLEMPVLALGGDACLMEYAQQSMEAVAENVRGGIIEHCGHWVPMERPDYLLEQLLDFFGENGGTEAASEEAVGQGNV